MHALQALTAAQQRTAAAALVVIVSLGTPWYSTQVAFSDGRVVNGSRSGIQAFSFVEAAVLVVALAVLALVWARATERRFSLPASDGTVITAAAGWLGLLIVYRLFDRPDGGSNAGTATLIGLSWGIFASLAAVGLLLATGLDQRRRAAAVRGPRVAPAEGPVVDPGDLVPQPAGPARSAAPVGTPGAAADDATRVAPSGAGEQDVTRVAPSDAAVEDVTRVAPTPRSWNFDDPDLPAPEPATPPSRRRPTPPEDPTRALGRDDAAEQPRDAGLAGTSEPAPDPRTKVQGRPRRRPGD